MHFNAQKQSGFIAITVATVEYSILLMYVQYIFHIKYMHEMHNAVHLTSQLNFVKMLGKKFTIYNKPNK